MTEIPIAIEGTATVDGRLITPGALSWPNEAIPVTMPSSGSQPTRIVGRAVNLRRAGTTIYATVELTDNRSPAFLTPQISIDSMQIEHQGDGVMHITAGRLRSIHLSNGGEAEFIAAFGPDTALSLLAALEVAYQLAADMVASADRIGMPADRAMRAESVTGKACGVSLRMALDAALGREARP